MSLLVVGMQLHARMCGFSREEGGLASGTGHGDPRQESLPPLRDPGTVLRNKDMKSGALGYGGEKTRRPGPEFDQFGKRILKDEVTGQGGPVCTQHSPCTPSPEIVPWVDSVSLLSYKESCVNRWQRKGRNSAQLQQPASQPACFPSGSYSGSPPPRSKQPPRIVSPPHLPSTTRVPCCPHYRRQPPGHERHTPLQPSQITEGTPQWPHLSC